MKTQKPIHEYKFICSNCFRDRFIQSRIRKSGKINRCSFCDEQGKCVEPTELEPIFNPLVNLYGSMWDLMLMEHAKETEPTFLWEAIQLDWDLFANDDPSNTEMVIKAIFLDTFDRKSGWPSIFEDGVVKDIDLYDVSGNNLEAEKKEWERFCREIKYENRYFHKNRVNLKLLEKLFESKTEFVNPSSYLFRARVIDSIKKPNLELGAPKSHQTKDGRANPRGIPYFYCCDSKYLAVLEVRPWIGSSVFVGRFRPLKKLRIVNFNKNISSPFELGKDLHFALSYSEFMKYLANEFSKPVNPSDPYFEYLPFQYISEYIKFNKYDGMSFESSQGKGKNYVVFKPNRLQLKDFTGIKIKGNKYQKISV